MPQALSCHRILSIMQRKMCMCLNEYTSILVVKSGWVYNDCRLAPGLMLKAGQQRTIARDPNNLHVSWKESVLGDGSATAEAIVPLHLKTC